VEIVTPTLRRSVAAAAVLLTAPALTACGFEMPTERVYTPGVGVNERSGAVDVLHALIVSGAEGSGTVIAGLNNSAREDDRLTGVSGSGEESGARVSADGPVDLPAGRLVQLADEASISIEGENINAGQFVTLTFTFANAEAVTVEVPVVKRTGEFAEIPVPSVAPTTEAPVEESSGH
jgi:hypothetical protein